MLQYFQDLLTTLAKSHQLAAWAETLVDEINRGLCEQRYGDLPQWRQALENLPTLTAAEFDLTDGVSIGSSEAIAENDFKRLGDCFKALIPWRKGPYSIFGLYIDSEWRSDWKWHRLQPHIKTLHGQQVLDVGCGNGYHCLRMLGAGASRVIGIDPSPRFVLQFLMLKQYLGNIPVDVLPIGIETLPPDLNYFDRTFSMGVLYHRRSPMDHLKALKATLKPGGQLLLETLIVEGEDGYCLVPQDRYAMMRNVWFIPSGPSMVSWLKKCGFTQVHWVDSNITSVEEQRVTDWMRYQSLADFLDPNDHTKTIEGHPAPMRGLFIAEKPL
ncbi:MAG: tRNA 5-methoxyuridine(34)/uridine 5-oxyacetic acid(34) synthase CmoB [Pseudomonadota bacterium]